MRHVDVVALLAYVKQLNPAQRIDEYTADAWAGVFESVPADLATARLAVDRVARDKTWIAPGEVRGVLRSMLPASAWEAPTAARALPGRYDVDHDRAERAHRGAAAARAELEKAAAARAVPLTPEPGVSETLARAREIARDMKRARQHAKTAAARPLADALDADPEAVVAQFKTIPERTTDGH